MLDYLFFHSYFLRTHTQTFTKSISVTQNHDFKSNVTRNTTFSSFFNDLFFHIYLEFRKKFDDLWADNRTFEMFGFL